MLDTLAFVNWARSLNLYEDPKLSSQIYEQIRPYQTNRVALAVRSARCLRRT